MFNSAILASFDFLNKFMLWANEKTLLNDSEEIVRREVANCLFNKYRLILFISRFKSIDTYLVNLKTSSFIARRVSKLPFSLK